MVPPVQKNFKLVTIPKFLKKIKDYQPTCDAHQLHKISLKHSILSILKKKKLVINKIIASVIDKKTFLKDKLNTCTRTFDVL